MVKIKPIIFSTNLLLYALTTEKDVDIVGDTLFFTWLCAGRKLTICATPIITLSELIKTLFNPLLHPNTEESPKAAMHQQGCSWTFQNEGTARDLNRDPKWQFCLDTCTKCHFIGGSKGLGASDWGAQPLPSPLVIPLATKPSPHEMPLNTRSMKILTAS